MEAENRQLREILLEERQTDNAIPSFRTLPPGSVDETAFVEVSARARTDPAPEEDPTVQCQTVCQFVRPNAVSPEQSEQKQGEGSPSAMDGTAGLSAADVSERR